MTTSTSSGRRPPRPAKPAETPGCPGSRASWPTAYFRCLSQSRPCVCPSAPLSYSNPAGSVLLIGGNTLLPQGLRHHAEHRAAVQQIGAVRAQYQLEVAQQRAPADQARSPAARGSRGLSLAIPSSIRTSPPTRQSNGEHSNGTGTEPPEHLGPVQHSGEPSCLWRLDRARRARTDGFISAVARSGSDKLRRGRGRRDMAARQPDAWPGSTAGKEPAVLASV